MRILEAAVKGAEREHNGGTHRSGETEGHKGAREGRGSELRLTPGFFPARVKLPLAVIGLHRIWYKFYWCCICLRIPCGLTCLGGLCTWACERSGAEG